MTKRTAFGITSLLTLVVVLAAGALAGRVAGGAGASGGTAALEQAQAENAALRGQVQALLDRERVYNERLSQANAAIRGAAGNTAVAGRPQVFEPPAAASALSQAPTPQQTAAPAAPAASRERERRSRERERDDD